MTDFSGLSIRGRVATPSDSDWDEARQAWNLAADQQPPAVALVESADDVSKVIGFARENGLKVTGQGTGHGAVALGSLEDTILIKTVRMRDVMIEDEKARVEAGALAEDVADAAIKEMASMPGTSPNVGVTGFTLGGGLSWFGRKYGWACNRVSAIEVVTADGEPRTVDAASDPDLFWALRGGGGGYAIVTALHLELLPIAEAYAGAMLFPPRPRGRCARTGMGARRRRRRRPWSGSSTCRRSPHPRAAPGPEVACDRRGVARQPGGGREGVAPLREIGGRRCPPSRRCPPPA